MPPASQSARTTADAGRQSTASPAEQSVRNYLNFLADRTQSKNAKEIARLEALIASTSDQIERLRLFASLEETRRPNIDLLVANFVRDAKDWAEAESIPAVAFLQLGVSEAVLHKAGIGKGRRSTARRRSAVSATRRVSVEDIKVWALEQSDDMTIKDVTVSLGGSLVTAKKALYELVADGSVAPIGPAPDRKGPGRAPARFVVVKKRRARV